MKVAIDTIVLYVQDVARLRKFYTEIFEMTVLEEDSLWTLLKAGDCKLGLHRIGDAYMPADGKPFKFESNCKIVFQISEDVKVARQNLLDRGVAMREIKTFENYDYWLCDGEDPEGNVFQLKRRKR